MGGRIRVVNEYIDETPSKPVYVLKKRTVYTAKEADGILKIGSGKLKTMQYTIPTTCPVCFSENKVVSYYGEGGHFRCLVCQHKWG